VGSILELAERSWNGELVGTTGLMRPTFETEEVADGLVFLQGFANVSALRTDEGLVLVDTGAYLTARRSFEAIRAVETGPVLAAVYTHGHVDHAFGLPPFLAEAEARGWPRPRIVGHRNLVGRFDRYRKTRGYNACINQRQFSLPRQLEWPDRYDYPDTVYDDAHTLRTGDTALELRHARGETDDHTWAWWPERKALFSGDQFVWVSPNAGNPQKAQRYPDEWALSLRRMAEHDAEILIPGHGPPILGAARVRRALEETAEWLEHLVRETLERMNAGSDLDRILHEVRPPAHLAERPYLQPVYDDPEYVVRNVWRLYGGWYDGVPSHLRPAPEDALAQEVAALAGGAEALARRAHELAEKGDTRLAGHLVDWAARAEPESRRVHEVRAEVYALRARRATALMSKGVFNAAARESRSRADGTEAPGEASG
jgi:alkyl sulfatase BDS1-like metallo-beta-lactamase superfamily hydrolase